MTSDDDSGRAALSSRALLQVLEGAPDAILLTDAAGTLRFANRQAEMMFGYTRDELIGQPVELLVPRALRASHGALRTQYMSRPSSRSMGVRSTLEAQRRDGGTFPVEVSLSPIETSEGRFVASAVRDVTERKRREVELRLANQRLLSAVESIRAMFALFDADDRLLLCNSEFRSLFAANSGPLLGKSFLELLLSLRDLFAVDQSATCRARWQGYHEHPDDTLDLITSDGRTLRIAEQSTPEGGSVMTIWNVSADVAREQLLEEARAFAVAASAAKSEFLASMSHELRTPLNAVLGFTQLLARDRREPPSDRQRERLQQVLRAGEHLLKLIEDVLDLSRIEAGRLAVSLEQVDAEVVLDDVLAALEPQAAREQMSLLRERGDRSWVCADRTRLMQVLMNFGSNAVKYGKRGGSVRFQVAPAEPGWLRLRVDDDGLGIAPEQQGKLFEPFQRAGQELGSIEGTGIGLAICKQLAALMNGRVGFESAVGVGSSFWIDLPASQPARRIESGRAQPRPRAHAATGGATRRLLYIEDNASNVAVMRDLIEELGDVELLVAPDGERGIELARTQAPSMVLMDINLPGISGWEAAARLHAMPETRAIPIVALSAARAVGQQVQAATFVRYLTKPVGVDELLETIESILSPSSCVGQSLQPQEAEAHERPT